VNKLVKGGHDLLKQENKFLIRGHDIYFCLHLMSRAL